MITRKITLGTLLLTLVEHIVLSILVWAVCYNYFHTRYNLDDAKIQNQEHVLDEPVLEEDDNLVEYMNWTTEEGIVIRTYIMYKEPNTYLINVTSTGQISCTEFFEEALVD